MADAQAPAGPLVRGRQSYPEISGKISSVVLAGRLPRLFWLGFAFWIGSTLGLGLGFYLGVEAVMGW